MSISHEAMSTFVNDTWWWQTVDVSVITTLCWSEVIVNAAWRECRWEHGDVIIHPERKWMLENDNLHNRTQFTTNNNNFHHRHCQAAHFFVLHLIVTVIVPHYLIMTVVMLHATCTRPLHWSVRDFGSHAKCIIVYMCYSFVNNRIDLFIYVFFLIIILFICGKLFKLSREFWSHRIEVSNAFFYFQILTFMYGQHLVSTKCFDATLNQIPEPSYPVCEQNTEYLMTGERE